MQKPKSFSFNRTSPSRKFNGNLNIDSLYDKTWNQYSCDFLAVNKFCYACGRKSEVTDHIVAHKGDINKFWKMANYLPLCKSCHNTITVLFDKWPVQKLNEKLKWISDLRLRLNLVFKVRVLNLPRGNIGKLGPTEGAQ